MDDYLKKIDFKQQHSSYDLSTLIMKQNCGYERHYLKISDENNKQMGMAIFNIDHTDSNEWRTFIRHVSTFDLSHLQKAVSIVVDYIWKNVYCSNIRVEIIHIKDADTG
jgi:hypothetical protein